MRSVANISEEYVASIFRARYGQKVFDKLQALNTLYRPDVSENKCTHFKIKDTLKNNSLTIYKISKFFNPKMQGHTHTHTHLHVHTRMHRNTQVHVDMSTVHFLATDTTHLTLPMQLNNLPSDKNNLEDL